MGQHFARKRFGQHFLSDLAIIDRIVGAIAPRAGQCIVEIGPGLGAMTQPLLERLGSLTVIELDRDLVVRLQKKTHLHVIAADVLTVDFSQKDVLFPDVKPDANVNKMRVVGNLPYNISTPVLFHLLNASHQIEDQHFMLQKEVVDRMVAKPSTHAYGRLSVMLQWRYHMNALFDVPPTAFSPPPQVMSAVVRMVPQHDFVQLDETLFSELVRVAFSQRRKLLRHSLGRWLEKKQYPGHFNLQRRAEEVPVSEYIALCQEVASCC